MKSILTPASLLVAFALLSNGCQSTAGNTAGESKAQESPESQMVADLAAARHLARWARDNNNAMAMAAAATVLKDTPTNGNAPKPEGARAAAGADKGGNKAPASAELLFAEARALAGQDQAMLAQIDRAAGERSRGRVGGPGQVRERVLANSNDIYEIPFRGGMPARIVVDGDRDTDLDLFVYDENGNLITADTDSTDICIVNWTPRWTGNFRVEVHNLGRVYNVYTLTTN